MRPVVETRRLRSPSEKKDQQRKAAARKRADQIVLDLHASLRGQDGELVIEVCRQTIRRLSRVVEAKGDIGRAQGVLAGAATDLSPAFQPEGKGRAVAEAVFRRRMA